MVEVYNNYLKVSRNDLLFKKLRRYLQVVEDSYGDKEPDIIDLFQLDDYGDMIILPGLDGFIPKSEERVDKRIKELPEPTVDIPFEELAVMSDKIMLRDDQIIAVKKATYLKNGILQLPTGIGKSEIIAGFLKVINFLVGHDIPTVILEPTTRLVEGTVERLNSYGIQAKNYSDCRGEIDGIIITHPSSLMNDLDKNSHLLNEIKIFIADECQHLRAQQWSRTVASLPKVEYRLGLSALVVDPNKLPITDIHKLDYEEIMAIGGTGNILMDMKASYYIQKGVLATPILFRLLHSADEWVRKDLDWTQVRKYRLESDKRTDKVAKVSAYLSNSGYKTLILVGTKKHAYKMMKMINDYGAGDICRCTFGGNKYYRWDEDKDKEVNCNKEEDTYDMYEKGKLRIFIGTSHIYEGADIPNLDVIIPASIGKKDRRVIQGIGRALRRSKKSKYGYAFIVDFTDNNCKVLSKQSRERLKIYTQNLGITNDRIYNGISFEVFKKIFHDIEQ